MGDGSFNLRPGQWTDDMSMALCLAESLVACGRFDPIEPMRRYVRWYREGYMSPTAKCLDIGNTVCAALDRFERSGDPWAGRSDPKTAGKGSLMRLAPVLIFYGHDAREAIARAADRSRTTHGALQAVDACR